MSNLTDHTGSHHPPGHALPRRAPAAGRRAVRTGRGMLWAVVSC